MADNDTEVVEGQGADEQPTQSGSETEASPSFDVETWAKGLDSKIDQLVEKKVQSFKDKRFDRLTGKVEDFASQLAEFKKLTDSGLSEDDALWRMKVEQRLGDTSEEQPSGETETSAVNVTTKAILEKLGLDENSPEVTAILRNNEDIAVQLAEFASLSASQKSKANQPNPAGVQPTGTGTVVHQDAEAIGERLIELQVNPMQNWAEIQKLTEELDKVQPPRQR